MGTIKWRMYIDFEKEEQWLNKMAGEGLELVSYKFGRYTFREGTPGEFIYRIEMLKGDPGEQRNQEYLAFMEDYGVEYVDSYMGWIYFRKKAADGPFEIYSDAGSKITHYKRVVYLFGIISALNLVIVLLNGTLAEYNVYLSISNFFIFVLFTPLLISYIRKINALKKGHVLYE